MPLGVQSANPPKISSIIDEDGGINYIQALEDLQTPKPRKPAYKPHDDLVEILRNCHRRFTDWRYGHLLTVCERLMSHFGIGEGEG